MRIIISPAKKMNNEPELFVCNSKPQFMNEAAGLLEYMRGLSYEKAKEIWKCNDAIAELNFKRFQTMDLTRNLTPAVLSYEGIQYQYMAPNVLEEAAMEYLEEHLRILSGFYGMLRPLDGIVPYRLEMQAKLIEHENKNLYEYWGEKLANQLSKETDCIVNLASKEYSKSITKYLPKDIKVVTCLFGELVDGKVKEKSPYVKMARGEMVRYMAEEKIESLEEIKQFTRLEYSYSEGLSDTNTYVFIK